MDESDSYQDKSFSHNRLPDIRSHSSLVNIDNVNSSMESKSNANKSPNRQRPVYLIGGGYNHKRNMSHSALKYGVNTVGIGEIKETETNL